MSSLRAIDLPTQRLEPLRPVETEAYSLPPTETTQAPLWAYRVEETIRIIARFGYSPTPTILLVSALVIAISLRTH